MTANFFLCLLYVTVRQELTKKATLNIPSLTKQHLQRIYQQRTKYLRYYAVRSCVDLVVNYFVVDIFVIVLVLTER